MDALGFALAHTAIFIEDNPSLVDRARSETATAERLNPKLAHVHLNRALIYWSWYDGWRIVDAMREYRRAHAIDPTLADIELGAGYAHLGLFDEWRRIQENVILQDPSNVSARRTFVVEYYQLNLAEEGRAALQRWLTEEPDQRYYLLVGRLEDAAPLVEEHVRRAPDNITWQADLALLRALQGRQHEARVVAQRVAGMLAPNRYRHHMTYMLARVAALRGDHREAVRWLEETIAWGNPCYPIFAKDKMLDPVRGTPEFQRLLSDLERTWNGYREALKE